DALAGTHVAELMAQPETASILRLLRADRANIGIYRLEELTGLRLEDLDHVVLGLKMQEAGLPVLAVRTQQPYDEQRVRAALKAKPTNKKVGDKMLDRI